MYSGLLLTSFSTREPSASQDGLARQSLEQYAEDESPCPRPKSSFSSRNIPSQARNSPDIAKIFLTQDQAHIQLAKKAGLDNQVLDTDSVPATQKSLNSSLVVCLNRIAQSLFLTTQRPRHPQLVALVQLAASIFANPQHKLHPWQKHSDQKMTLESPRLGVKIESQHPDAKEDRFRATRRILSCTARRLCLRCSSRGSDSGKRKKLKFPTPSIESKHKTKSS